MSRITRREFHLSSVAAAAAVTPRQPIGARRQAQRPDMGRHMGAIGEQRHGVIGKPADDLHHHEKGGDDGGPFGAGLGMAVALAQKDMVAGPDAVTMSIFLRLLVAMRMAVVMPMIMPVSMGMTMSMTR